MQLYHRIQCELLIFLNILVNYLSIFLYVLTPEGDIRRVQVNQVLGVSLFVFCAMLVVLVVSERSQCLPYHVERAPSKVAIFNTFGMARPGFEPATSRSRSGRSTAWAIVTGNVCDRILSRTVENACQRAKFRISSVKKAIWHWWNWTWVKNNLLLLGRRWSNKRPKLCWPVKRWKCILSCEKVLGITPYWPYLFPSCKGTPF